MKLNLSYRIILIVILSIIIVKNIIGAVLLVNLFDFIDITVNSLLLYLILTNHRWTSKVLEVWAWFYLICYAGIMAGAKTLVILAGNGWEINKYTYSIDLFMFCLGLWIIGSKAYMLRKQS